MRVSSGLCSTLAAASTIHAYCSSPEPTRRICYSDPGGVPQDISIRDLEAAARTLRRNQKLQIRSQKSPFWIMKSEDADECAEWLVLARGGIRVFAKHVGNKDSAVTLVDIANTIQPDPEGPARDGVTTLLDCGRAGGQMGVVVNATDPLYKSAEFVDGGFTADGIIVKVVKGASDS